MALAAVTETPLPVPVTCNGDLARLPPALAHLRKLRVWVNWRWVWVEKRQKWDKPPFRVDNPKMHASTSDPCTWGTYEQAVENVLAGRVDGVGFVIKGCESICTIDLDGAYIPGAGITPWARGYVERFTGAYVEVTVSGTGLRIIGTGHIPLSSKYKLPEHGKGAAIEFFSQSNHYNTLSCNPLYPCEMLPPIGDEMQKLEAELAKPKNGNGFDFTASTQEQPATNVAPAATNVAPVIVPGQEWSFAEENRVRAALAAIPADEALLNEMFRDVGGSRPVWLNVGFALHSLGWGDQGFAIWRGWCRGCASEFDDKGLRYIWSRFKDERTKRITIGTLFHYAKLAEQRLRNGPTGELPITRLKAWLARPLGEPDYVLGNMLTTTSRALLWAPTGLGKTMWGIAAALRMAEGCEWLAWAGQRPLRVLYVDGEMSQRLLKVRLADEVRRSGICPDGMHVLSHEDIPDFQPLNTPEGQKQIEGYMADLGGFDFAWFDNIMSLTVGDMKDEESWRQTLPWVKSLTRRQIGQVWIHHTGHDTSKGYGSKTKEWQMDTVMGLSEVEREDTDVSFKLTFHKARERTPATREQFAERHIALVNDQWQHTSAGKPADHVSPLGLKYLEALRNAIGDEKMYGHPAATLVEWRACCVKLGLIDKDAKPNTQRALFSKHKLELLAANRIACNDTMAWVL